MTPLEELTEDDKDRNNHRERNNSFSSSQWREAANLVTNQPHSRRRNLQKTYTLEELRKEVGDREQK